MENEAQVRQLVAEAVENARILRNAEEALEDYTKAAHRYQATVDQRRRVREEHNRAIRALGFHDIGHALGELQKAPNA